jgi:DNA-binding transcriptional LysR family regulator
MNWDDLRLFLAVARSDTSRAAARSLGVNQSTVSRRVKQFERDVGVQLFDRRTVGLRLTEAGREMVASAERIEQDFALLDRKVLGRDVRLDGQIRVSLPDLMVTGLAPVLVEFGERYPTIEVEVSVDNSYVSLTHRAADVALRLVGAAPEHLVGRRIAGASLAIYGTPGYLEDHRDPPDLACLDWVGWEEPWRDVAPEQWLAANVPAERVRARVNTNLAHTELIASGLGVGFQFCYTGDSDSRLLRIGNPIDFGLSLWLLTHEDLRGTARIRAFMSFVGEALARQRGLMEAA